MQNIRNFAIIAHVDHGKSTLADRLMELTGTIEKNQHEEQMLDRNPISRERGITIKLAPVEMKYSLVESQMSKVKSKEDTYTLNLIDTPGHVDFSYEVDRTLACVEGVILLVDATQGIQAQTIANAYKAIEKDLTIIPVLNKIDLPSAEVEKNRRALSEFLGVSEDEIIGISAKSGENVDLILEKIVKDIPSPASRHSEHSEESQDIIDSRSGSTTPSVSVSGMTKVTSSRPNFNDDVGQALIFDSYFDPHQGVIAFVRVFSGTFSAQDSLYLLSNLESVQPTEVGIFKPDLTPTIAISSGDIGYIVTNLKDIHDVQVGDTISNKKDRTLAISGYKKVKPMVYASLFPTDTADFENLQKALEKIYLTDSSLEFNQIYSTALGAGYRVGFLGLLHADVIRERLEREYELNLVITPPKVDFQRTKDKYKEPIVRIFIVTPKEHMGMIMELVKQYRGRFLTMDNKSQITMEYEMPLAEMISDFFDKLKSVSSGYASFNWELDRYEAVNADYLEILLNGDPVEEFSEIVVFERAEEKARELTKKLKEVIPRQQYEVKIQAKYKGRIIASERIAPFRKDVTAKLYGGDRTRKDKLLKKQKEGKKKMKMIGKVEVPKEAFVKLFKN